MWRKNILLIYYVLSLWPYVMSQNQECYSKESCGECIQTPNCAWCFNPDSYGESKCFNSTISLTNYCQDNNIINPFNTVLMQENKPLSFIRQVEQVIPQKIKINLRKGSPLTLHMQYLNQDQPIDIYFLVDAKSMNINNRNNIIYLSEELIETFKNYTRDLRVGFGSFVDKVVFPFVDTSSDKLISPCKDCAAPYGFYNHLALSAMDLQTLKGIRQFKKSSSLTSLNGGLDAVMQAIVCSEQIGWRKSASKLIIFMSDNGLHVAGDGQEAGINLPNDGTCHLDNTGFYTKSTDTDYPSIVQLSKKAVESSIKIIFAVAQPISEHYKNKTSNFKHLDVVNLNQSYANVLELVHNYMTTIVEIPELEQNGSSVVNLKVLDVKVTEDRSIEYTFSIELLNCPEERQDYLEIVQITPHGSTVNLIIEIEMLCVCECEKPGSKDYVTNSPICSNQGTYKCGVCQCNDGSYGRNCECTMGTESSCSPNNTTTLCSGIGTCICNYCECPQRYNPSERVYGKYCECDNFSCNRFEGNICGGSHRGICECGQCLCNPGWMGEDCSCSTSKDSRFDPENIDRLICSGNGICMCGKCKCQQGSGEFCETRTGS